MMTTLQNKPKQINDLIAETTNEQASAMKIISFWNVTQDSLVDTAAKVSEKLAVFIFCAEDGGIWTLLTEFIMHHQHYHRLTTFPSSRTEYVKRRVHLV
jgi:hypothetical protein